MVAVGNLARERLERGELSLGVGIRVLRSVEVAKAMKSCRLRLAVHRSRA